MRYWRSYQYIFDNPKWGLNVLFGVLCQVIPAVGPLVWMGYQFEVIEGFHRQGNDSSYPDFSFDRFVKYLVRGVWPFLVALVVALPFGLIMGSCWGIGILTIASTDGGRGGVGVLFILIFFILYLTLAFLLGIMMIPLSLRAGLGQDFAKAFSFEFVKDFFQRTWQEVVVAQLFLFATGIGISLLGVLACFIGIYPAIVIVTLAQYHVYFQLYELYLQRGGTPIPLKEEPVPPPP